MIEFWKTSEGYAYPICPECGYNTTGKSFKFNVGQRLFCNGCDKWTIEVTEELQRRQVKLWTGDYPSIISAIEMSLLKEIE